MNTTVHLTRAHMCRMVSVGLVLACTVFPRVARAGDYMDRAVLLVRQARQELEYLEGRRGNRELSALIHRLAVARLTAARDGYVPKEVVQAHPHLLLMLENCERAADAAESRESERFLNYEHHARDEEQIFRSIMRQLGFPLEDERKK